MIAYLVDTDWVADFLRGKEPAIQFFSSLADVGLGNSIITYAELYEGVLRATNPDALTAQLEDFVASVDVIGVDRETARFFAQTRTVLRKQGLPIPDHDLSIAATALRYELNLVSRDQHFERIQGLKRA